MKLVAVVVGTRKEGRKNCDHAVPVPRRVKPGMTVSWPMVRHNASLSLRRTRSASERKDSKSSPNYL